MKATVFDIQRFSVHDGPGIRTTVFFVVFWLVSYIMELQVVSRENIGRVILLLLVNLFYAVISMGKMNFMIVFLSTAIILSYKKIIRLHHLFILFGVLLVLFVGIQKIRGSYTNPRHFAGLYLTTNLANLILYLVDCTAKGHIADVTDMFIVPYSLLDLSTLVQNNGSVGGESYSFYTMPYSTEVAKFISSVPKQYSFSDYQPKNNKALCYPYNYLLVTNNIGNQNIYKYEDFTTENCVFENQFSIAVGGSGRVVPKNYKRMATNDDEALPLGKYPTCAWSSDAFTNWLTQNAVNMSVSLGLTAGSIAGTIATGGATAPILAGAVMSVAGNIGNTIGQFYQASLLPNISGGQATGDVIWACNRNKFSFRQMRVKTEYLKIIDDYFTRFGYAIRSLEMPNITGRRYWNYVEIGASEEIGYGEVPSKFMDIINNACRKGVTIWHNHANVGNYSLNNTIV